MALDTSARVNRLHEYTKCPYTYQVWPPVGIGAAHYRSDLTNLIRRCIIMAPIGTDLYFAG